MSAAQILATFGVLEAALCLVHVVRQLLEHRRDAALVPRR